MLSVTTISICFVLQFTSAAIWKPARSLVVVSQKPGALGAGAVACMSCGYWVLNRSCHGDPDRGLSSHPRVRVLPR
jgi:hypothetical protein